jgi:hypothetical protein
MVTGLKIIKKKGAGPRHVFLLVLHFFFFFTLFFLCWVVCMRSCTCMHFTHTWGYIPLVNKFPLHTHIYIIRYFMQIFIFIFITSPRRITTRMENSSPTAFKMRKRIRSEPHRTKACHTPLVVARTSPSPPPLRHQSTPPPPSRAPRAALTPSSTWATR